jgi:hypothetical protein
MEYDSCDSSNNTPDESLLSLSPMPWFANHINFLATGDLPAHWSTKDK